MIDASPAFISDAGVGSAIGRVPIISGMALCTIGAEHARMKGWIAVTRDTCRGKTREGTR